MWIPQYFQADAFLSETVRQGRELRLFQAAAVRRRSTEVERCKILHSLRSGLSPVSLADPTFVQSRAVRLNCTAITLAYSLLFGVSTSGDQCVWFFSVSSSIVVRSANLSRQRAKS